jgi:SAM-dependent methyltransferase
MALGHTTSLRRTAERWDAEAAWEVGRGIFWSELPAVQRRLNMKVSGRPDVGWVPYTLEQHLAGRLPMEQCLVLGCGRGGLELLLAGLGAFVTCQAVDVASGSVAEAEASARQAGFLNIQHAVQDINHIELLPRSYDAVWASDAVHHFERLEHVFAQVARALKPGGLFILHEYVGPNRFQFPPRQRQLIHACHDLLPVARQRITEAALDLSSSSRHSHDWRWFARRVVDKARDGDLPAAASRWLQRTRARRSGQRPTKTTPNLPTVRSVEAVDPSEAIRSAEIVPLLQRDFEIVDYKPLGGSILQFLLADIAGNFQDEGGERLLEMLFSIEDVQMELGDLASDFAYIVATPPRDTYKPRDQASRTAV